MLPKIIMIFSSSCSTLGSLGDGFVHREDVHPDTGGLAQQQGGLFHLVVGGVIVHHDDALCAHMASPREYHLTVTAGGSPDVLI